MRRLQNSLHLFQLALAVLCVVGSAHGAIAPTSSSCPSCVQAQKLMTEGLIELGVGLGLGQQSNGRDRGFRSLEQGFKVAQEPWRKAEFAWLLAQAPEKVLHHRKHHYAAYALEHHKALDHADRSKLLVILGDGAFDQGNVPLAQKSYARVLELHGASARDREYATFKLGWTLLNQHAPLKAYELWKTWLLETAEDAGLREDMVQAASRAWVESLGVRPWQNLDRTEAERTAAVTGMRRSLIRLPVEQARGVVSAARLPEPGFRFEVLKDWWKYRTPPRRPCDALPLIQELSAEPSQLEGSEALAQELRTAGLRCLKSQIEMRGKHREDVASTLGILERLKPKGLEWWSLSAIYAQMGQSDQACRATVAVLKDTASHTALSETDQEQLWISAQQNCKPPHADLKVLGALLADSPFWNVRWQQSGGQMVPGLASVLRLAQLDEVLRGWFPKFLDRHPTVAAQPWFVQWAWRTHGHRFVDVANGTRWTAQLPQAQRVACAQLWFARDPGPNSELWGWMERWLPWSGGDAVPHEVLKLWAMSQRVLGRNYLELVEKIGAATPQVSEPREPKTAALWALGEWSRLEQWDIAWRRSPHVDQALLENPVLFEAYLGPGFELALREPPVPVANPGKVWAWIEHVAGALRAGRRVQQPAPWTVVQQRRAGVVQGVLKDLAVWNRLVSLRQDFEQLQDWGQVATLEKKILREMERLKNIRQTYQRHAWTLSATQQASRVAFGKTRDALAEAIERVNLDDPASQQQLLEVSAVVKTWEVGT